MVNELIVEFERKFEEVKKDLKFRSNLAELEEIFFFKDFILEKGFVSSQLSRMICRRIVDLFGSWYNYLQGIIIPNPGNMVTIIESQMFDEKEKEKIIKLMDTMLSFTYQNSVIGLSRDKVSESKFIDESVKLWDECKPKILEIVKKIASKWKEKSITVQKKQVADNMFR